MTYPHRLKRAVPNFFTFGNMFCGFLSVLSAHQGEYINAVWLIGLAAICDTLDGIAARLTKSSSQFGIELDSIADVISFGFAPAFLIYTIELHEFGIAGMIAAASLLLAGGFRLARFNTQLVGFDKQYFVGLPIPAGAITIASYVLLFYVDGAMQVNSQYYTILLTLSVAFLMASHVRYETIPKPNIQGMKARPVFFLLFGIACISSLVTLGRAVFIVFILFILFGIFKHVKNLLTGGPLVKSKTH